MNKIYENIFIGTFIYSMGVLSGIRKASGSPLPWISLNLFQQTPADQYIGDLFGSLGGRNFIIEFKSGKSLDKKESNKQATLIEALDNETSAISLKSHFFSGGTVSESGNATLEFSRYIEMGAEAEKFNINEFANGVFNGAVSKSQNSYKIGSSGKEIKSYIDLLKELYEGESSSSTGGLIANISKSGQISYISTSNIFELTLTLEQLNTNLTEAKEYNRPTPSQTMSPGGW
ncbi:hypothetical protein ACJJIE_11375 [Microbulbifer sp. TRSA001]|uniref:hypothetical protein n=1 Tax=Microbulbifer sp. TRSA001 TaxID=3243381 RepID=UPI0040391CA9